MTDITVFKAPIEGILITEPSESNISPAQLENYVKDVENNNIQSTYDLIFNDNVFEVGSCILRYKGRWLFWHEAKAEIMSWDWDSDIAELIEACDDQSDIDSLNQGWTLHRDNDYSAIDPEDEDRFIAELDAFIAKLSMENN